MKSKAARKSNWPESTQDKLRAGVLFSVDNCSTWIEHNTLVAVAMNERRDFVLMLDCLAGAVTRQLSRLGVPAAIRLVSRGKFSQCLC